jgi:hypothetical protein
MTKIFLIIITEYNRIISKHNNLTQYKTLIIPVAVQSKAQVCSCFIAKMVVSNPSDGMVVHHSCFLCVFV